ncbi:MAG TPA: T9SS type A sorting domain-containing protein, partial [Flavitalea sp.]|nr:T9SS type A sorting domain-containing protein [Flavitalea sp.]
QFTILKDAGKKTDLSVSTGTPVTLVASWMGAYRWSNGATSKSILVTPGSNTTYIVTDEFGCIGDTFNISIATSLRSIRPAVATEGISEKRAFTQVYPTVVKRGSDIIVKSNEKEIKEVLLLDLNGRIISSHNFNGSTRLNTTNLAIGTYFIQLKKKGRFDLERVIVTN